MAADQERISGGFARGGLRELANAPSAEGAGAATQDADVDQPDRDHVLDGPAQQAAYQAFRRKRDASTLTGWGVSLYCERQFKRVKGFAVIAQVITTIEAANQFVETWLPRYNRRFAVQPAQAADLPHGPRARPDAVPEDDADRAARLDRGPPRPAGTMRITHRGQSLRYFGLTARPVRMMAPTPPAAPQRSVKPKPTHPWHRRLLPDRHKTSATPMT